MLLDQLKKVNGTIIDLLINELYLQFVHGEEFAENQQK